MFPHGRSIVRIRATQVDDGYGGTRPDWTTATRTTIDGWAVAPFAPSTQADVNEPGRTGIVEGFTLYNQDYDVDVAATDRLELDGTEFEIIGEIMRWHNPFTGHQPGVAVTVRRVEG